MHDFKDSESKVLKSWEKDQVYEKVKKKNSKGRKFYFLQGPPYTSGKLHIGQAWNNTLKDAILRFRRMQGYDVWDRGGYDMHGLPTEHAVQKKLKLKTKEDIIRYGTDKFVKECLKFSNEHAGYMNEDLWKLGVWLDHENAYKPVEKDFISGQWTFFKKAWEQKRLYKGAKVMHWDAETETSLAKHELEYETVEDTSIFLKFRKKGTDNEYFVIWTTTPWTIPFNLAIMVNPEITYVRARVDDEVWIVAKDLAGPFISGLLGKKPEILEQFPGSELEGQEYVHVLNDELNETYERLKKESKNIHTIILNKQYVDTSAGTGLVHCAPGSGPEDQEAAAKYDIQPFNTLNEQGRFEELGKYTGWKAKEEDEKFLKEFESKGALIATTKVEHEYPHSWRSHKPVIFRTTEQWFLKIEDLVPKLLELNKKVHWEPKKSGESYERWTSNLKDNSVTRQRFWGCPIPIWVNEEDEEDVMVIGSVEELEKMTGRKFDDLSLHKPWIDKTVIEKKGKRYRRVPDVSDVWLDSGTVSWNCLYNEDSLIKRYFPADLVLEATEQTRLWFSMLQICSTIMFDKTAYENVYTHGMIFDYQGTKMSKSLGNIISPYEVIDKFSVDIFRNYITQITAGENINFSWEDIKVKQRNLLILKNIGNFIADLEMQKPGKGRAGIEERWIISRLNSTLKKVTELFDKNRIDETVAMIEGLYMNLSRDYIKFVRDKAGANGSILETIREVFHKVLLMFCPVCPFLMEELWQGLGGKDSIHLSSWPSYDKGSIDEKLEKEFDLALQVIEKGLAARDKAGIGLKWPLSRATVTLNEPIDRKVMDVIAGQLNVKEVGTQKGKRMDVLLDTTMTPELEAEGFAREVARRVQTLRKKKGLKKTDEIGLKIHADGEMKNFLEKHEEFLEQRTGSKTVDFVDDKKGLDVFTIKDKKVWLGF